MYSLQIDEGLMKKLDKLRKKNRKQVEIILKKADEVVKDPHRYKNLRAPLNMWNRVHIDKHFVLVYSVDDSRKVVTLEDYNHHDVIYNR
jgi:YafQ family addiction module toxin component|tara:strand:- start:11 stop:277 length:267 start_codon:yes stop_codon:yes gene_type:complete